MGCRTILVTFFWCHLCPRFYLRWLTTFSVELSIDWFFKILPQGSQYAQHCSIKTERAILWEWPMPAKMRKTGLRKKERRRKLAPDLKERFSHTRQAVRREKKGSCLPWPICFELREKVNHVVTISLPFLGHAWKEKFWAFLSANETPLLPSDYKWRHELLCGLGRQHLPCFSQCTGAEEQNYSN